MSYYLHFITIAAALDHATRWILKLRGQESLLVQVQLDLKQAFYSAKFKD